MLRAAGWRGRLWWYTLAIPAVAACLVLGAALTWVSAPAGLALMAVPLGGTFLFVWRKFGGLRKAVPRWVARWVLIWPYSWGILKGLATRVPKCAGVALSCQPGRAHVDGTDDQTRT